MEFLKAFAMSGGEWVIHLLIVASVVALAVILERIYVLYFQRALPVGLTRDVEAKLRAGDRKGAMGVLSARKSVAQRLHPVLEKPGTERRMDSILALEKRSLERRLIILGTLANNAPFIGLLGTVLGVIRAFHDLARNPQAGPETVMQGLSEALVATAVGILVAIPCAAAYNVLKKRVRDLLLDAECHAKHWLELASAGAEG